MPKIAEDLDKWLLEQRVIDQATRRKGVISPSSLGQCFRRQYWTRKGEVESNPIDVQTLRVFEAGKSVHKLIQQLYPEASREVEVTMGADVYGHADLVFEDEVKDIKSVGTFQFKKFQKLDAHGFALEKPDYVMQVIAYAIALGKSVGTLCLVSKDTWEIVEHGFPLETHRAAVETEIKRLREIWDRQELPQAECRLYGGKEKNYCQFCTKCEITEGTKAF